MASSGSSSTIIQSTASGAAAGSASGPWGTAIGAGLGFFAGITQAHAADEQFKLQMELAGFSLAGLAETREFAGEQFGLQTGQIESKAKFGREQLAAQQTLLDIGKTSRNIQEAVQGGKFRTASREISKQSRTKAGAMKSMAAFRGSSASFRAGLFVDFAAMADVESQVEVSRQMGLISEKQYQTQVGQLQTSERQLESERQFNLSSLESSYQHQLSQIGFQEQSTRAQMRSAQHQQGSGGFLGKVIGDVAGIFG